MQVVLISTYELGRQPFGLASPAAWLRGIGAQVACVDLSRGKLEKDLIRRADLVAFYLPMHTATRIALDVIRCTHQMNPSAYLCAYGLYAPLNKEYLFDLGIRTIIGGEFEEGLRDLVINLTRRSQENGSNQTESLILLSKQKFLIPDRSGLPALKQYAQIVLPDGTQRIVGYTEASRGCKHLCRHCPIVPVYKGQFRVVQRDVVIEDIRQQVAAGAQHITFGDPDFFNGVGHAIEIVHTLHREFPCVTYDATIKIEHLLKHAGVLHVLAETGCAFITSAVESIDDRVLKILDKSHTKADFIEVLRLCRENSVVLTPTFVTFTPWLTLEGYEDLLALLAQSGLIQTVAPIQLAIRLLIPSGSLLLENPGVQSVLGPFDEVSLTYQWTHPDPRVDQLHHNVDRLVRHGSINRLTREEIFQQIWDLLQSTMGSRLPQLPLATSYSRIAVPYLTEPWFC